MKVRIDVNGLDKAINMFDSKMVEQKMSRAMDKIANVGYQEASMRYSVAETDMNNRPYVGISNRGQLNKEIYAIGKDVAFIEFGTGILMEEHPLQNEVEGIVPHGMYGKGLGSDPKGWWYRKVRHIGINAQRCLYETGKTLVRDIPKIVKEVFND